MGNQLVGVAPSQIYPVDHYLNGSVNLELRFDASMGSTRFFKVARARTEEGAAVVKVFVIHDPSLPLQEHSDRLDYIKKHLSGAVNCLPFQRHVMTEKAAFIIREYVKHSLYDKVSTRPFLTVLEKRWITFQILCALNQCHKQKICHGDIKLENILITSWNWILLADFASFKPTFLPEDNPADFTYFFDTSRRRACYIAPERFVKPAPREPLVMIPVSETSETYLNESIIDSNIVSGGYATHSLLPEMDIFSAGCALLELWSEGKAPFELSQLLAYRKGEMELVAKHLRGVENDHLRDMIASMISLNPKERKSAELYLDEEKGRLFPEYFYSFLQPYIQIFSSIPLMSPDDKVMRFSSDIDQIVELLAKQPNDWTRNGGGGDNKTRAEFTNEGLIIITALVTSCIRGLQHCVTKLRCLEILQQLATHSESETILDRILPYILHLTSDSIARVRVAAIDTLTACLCMVTEIKRSDANIFPEYVFFSIAPLAIDTAVVVRVAYARNIAVLAETSVRFLKETQHLFDNETQALRFDREMSALHEMLQQTVSCLLTDTHSIVKRTLIESNVGKLCEFFGRQKSNDCILSHMITFLNYKEDTNLRGTFFDCIVVVAKYVGWHCSDILLPLLQQGLSDLDEFVVVKSIRATAALCRLRLIQKAGLSVFITECAPFLNHPNLWIRHETCGLLQAATITFSAIDIQCKVMPVISMHLRSPVLQLERPDIVMNNLHPPIPRPIFEAVIRFVDIIQLMQILEKRKKDREVMQKEGIPIEEEPMSSSLRNFFRRFTTEPVDVLVEMQLLSMKSCLMKLNKYKSIEKKIINDGKIVLEMKPNVCHEYLLTDSETDPWRQRKSENSVNSDWQMTTLIDQQSGGAMSPSNESGHSVGLLTSPSASSANHIPLSSLIEYSLGERSFLQIRSSECSESVEALRQKIKDRYQVQAATRDFGTIVKARNLPSDWRLKGQLIANLHEHKSNVTKLVTLPSVNNNCNTTAYNPLFASCSTDGTVRVWDVSKLDGNHSINRSSQVYSSNVPLFSMAACNSGRSLAVGGKDGSLMLLRLDSNSTKMALQQVRQLDAGASLPDGHIVDMHPLEHGSNSLIVYATLYGSLVCWDLRMPGDAWKLRASLRKGVVTTFCTDLTGAWLTLGTSSGKHSCWDLRFRLAIAEIRHPQELRVRKIVPHPTEHSKFLSAVSGNNEVSIWDIETGEREGSLWASSAPPLTTSNQIATVCGMVAGTIGNMPYVFTAGSDQRIRFWDLSGVGDSSKLKPSPSNCKVVVAAAREHIPEPTYDCRLIDGATVLMEKCPNTNASSATNVASGSNPSPSLAATRPTTSSGPAEEQQPRCGPEMPTVGHKDVITELLMCQNNKHRYLASSSRDGIIKLWK